MSLYRITYSTDAADEVVEADRVAVEAGGQIVLHQIVMVIGQPREIVVLRLRGRDVASVQVD